MRVPTTLVLLLAACSGAPPAPAEVVVPRAGAAPTAAPQASARAAVDAGLPKDLREEIRSTLGAMTRAAVAAHERETFDATLLPSGATSGEAGHQLCGSAVPVPAQIPRGAAHAPGPRDFESGSSTEGWRCLKFMLSEPFRCQYSYSAGSGYKGPRRGYPDPGPQGFEVAAECDPKGDGQTHLVTRTGVVKNGQVVAESSYHGLGPD